MNPSKILLLGTKGAVIAFDQETGARLWSQSFKGNLEHFVTVVADLTRVYAHTNGKIFCLDLATGRLLWHDELTGLGYGIASLAIPGQLVPSTAMMGAGAQQDAGAAGT